jgi:hypothetical protein
MIHIPQVLRWLWTIPPSARPCFLGGALRRMNALGNVYIIQKQVKHVRSFRNTKVDRYGNNHEVFYFRSHESFAKTFAETNSGSGVVWDVDMDFFISGRSIPDQY